MAVFEGARLGQIPLARRATPAASVRGSAQVERRRRAATVRARRRNGPVTIVLATVLTAFLLGLIYLTQTLQSAATAYQVDQLLEERRTLLREIQSLEGVVARWGAEPLVVERAAQLGLDRLGGRLYVPIVPSR